MSFFSRAKNFEIAGGIFAEKLNIVNYFPGRHSGIDALLEAAEPDAAHNSAARTLAPRCHPGTREKFIKELVRWTTPSTFSINPPPLSWMKGCAGVGKSAIARTCVERLKHMSIACASFFFSINGRKDPRRLFPTIAYHLCLEVPDYHEILNRRISDDKTVLAKSLRGQFQGLITDPLQELTKKRIESIKRITIFIDGLDECQDKEAQCEIVEIIAEAARWSTLPLHWAFFSRPEAHIEATFAQRHVAALTRVVELPISRNDDREIERFLRDGFERMLGRRNMPRGYAWPSAADTQELVDAADGLFIYASAALRFIDDPKWPEPQEPLRLVLDSARSASKHGTVDGSPLPFSELDALYLMIMQNIPSDKFPLTCLLLTLVHLEGEELYWLSGSQIITQSNCLGLSEFDYRALCSNLNSVLRVRDSPPPSAIRLTFKHIFQAISRGSLGPVYSTQLNLEQHVDFYHKSFVDFLVDPTRSGKYCITTPSVYVNLLVHLSDIYLTSEPKYVLHRPIFSVKVSKNTLSCPSTKYATHNTEIAIFVFNHFLDMWLEMAPWISATGGNTVLYKRLSEWNFRKSYRVRQCAHGLFIIKPLQWGCKVQIDWVKRVELLTLRDPEFAKFDVLRFKKMVEDQLRGGLLHESTQTSSRKIDEQFCQSGLFILGQGKKSVFWYWEIDFKEKVYREFHAPNLDEGMNAFEQKHPINPRSWLSTLTCRRMAGEGSR